MKEKHLLIGGHSDGEWMIIPSGVSEFHVPSTLEYGVPDDLSIVSAFGPPIEIETYIAERFKVGEEIYTIFRYSEISINEMFEKLLHKY